MSEISDNQKRLILALVGPSKTTLQLGDVRDAGGARLTPDVARKTLGRLEARGLVKGEGTGRDRVWELTAAGETVAQEASVTKDWTRPYVVLEKTTLEQLLERLDGDDLAAPIYLEVDTVAARNVEHAFKLASNHPSFDGEDVDTTMVAVSTRNFQPEEIHISNRRDVTVGGAA